MHKALVESILNPVPESFVDWQNIALESKKAETAYNKKLSDFSQTLTTLSSLTRKG